MKVYVLLPAYNEEEALPPLLERIESTLARDGIEWRAVVVNDGSTDRTAEVLDDLKQRYPLDTVTHRFNRGLGETARDGFEYIADIADAEDVVVRMDCDDTHDPRYIRDMLAKIDEGFEAVIASRYAPGGGQEGVNLYRRTISRIANLIMKGFFPMSGVQEYSCGYRAYRVALIRDALAIFGNRFIDLKGMGFTGTVEKIIKLKMMGARVCEVGFVLRYDRKPGVSKVVTSITTLGYLMLILKYIAFWGSAGDEWRAAIEERKARVYDAEGQLRVAKEAG